MTTLKRDRILQTGRAIASLTSSHEIELQAVDRNILLATCARGLCGRLGQNPETSQRPLTAVFLECDRWNEKRDASRLSQTQ